MKRNPDSNDDDKNYISYPCLSHDEFRQSAYKIIDLIVEYRKGLRQQPVAPNLLPGQCANNLNSDPPLNGTTVDNLLKQYINNILPGVVHWQHPRFFGFFPLGGSYASILGSLLINSLSVMGFSWDVCPISTEMEIVVTKWLAKAIGLPGIFMASEVNSNSISYFLPTSSEAIIIAMHAARKEHTSAGHDISKLVVYASRLAHGCIKKAANILGVLYREVDPHELRINEIDQEDNNEDYDDNDDATTTNNQLENCLYKYGMKKADVEREIEKDVRKGLIPFFISCTLGTTDICSFDQLDGMQSFVDRFNVWLHVDASYAAVAFICPELRYTFLKGLDHFHSFSTNPYKWLLMNHDGCCFWSSKRSSIEDAMRVDSSYLRIDESVGKTNVSTLNDHIWGVDLRKYSLATSRNFSALKLWSIFELYGVTGLQKHIRKHVELAQLLANLVKSDKRTKLVIKPRLGLVCFRLHPHITPKQTFLFLDRINSSRSVFLCGSLLTKNTCVIRVCVSSEGVTEQDILYLWKLITKELDNINPCHTKV